MRKLNEKQINNNTNTINTYIHVALKLAQHVASIGFYGFSLYLRQTDGQAAFYGCMYLFGLFVYLSTFYGNLFLVGLASHSRHLAFIVVVGPSKRNE